MISERYTHADCSRDVIRYLVVVIYPNVRSVYPALSYHLVESLAAVNLPHSRSRKIFLRHTSPLSYQHIHQRRFGCRCPDTDRHERPYRSTIAISTLSYRSSYSITAVAPSPSLLMKFATPFLKYCALMVRAVHPSAGLMILLLLIILHCTRCRESTLSNEVGGGGLLILRLYSST